MGLAVRHKSESMAIQTLADLDNTIKLIGLLDLNVEQIESDLDVAIKTLRDAALAEAAPIHTERDILFAMCQQFVASHRDELLRGKQTKTLNYGLTGYRRTSAKIKTPSRGTPDMEELCDAIIFLAESKEDKETAALFKTVTIHFQRFVAQSDLKPLPDDLLKMIGLVRNPPGEVFFLTADKEKLVEVQSA